MSQGGDVNAMLPGQKKCGIFGFCDIRFSLQKLLNCFKKM